MQSRSAAALLVALGLTCFSSMVEASAADIADEPEVRKLLAECRDPDYRTYIKCLKRHKRHQARSEPFEEAKSNCLNTCGMEKCTTHACAKDCYSRCFKKTKEVHQVITEYGNECTTGDCLERSVGATNITTNIDIKNVINTNNPTEKSVSSRNCTCRPGGICEDVSNTRKECINGPCKNCNPPISPWRPWPGFNLMPQIQLVPQITFGLGLGSVNLGCIFPSSWSCVNQPQYGGVDCSGCGNPVVPNKCDNSCYAPQNSRSPNFPQSGPAERTHQWGDATGDASRNADLCRSPYCIGGT